MNTYDHDLLLRLQTNFIFTKKRKGFFFQKIKGTVRNLTQNTLKELIYKYTYCRNKHYQKEKVFFFKK